MNKKLLFALLLMLALSAYAKFSINTLSEPGDPDKENVLFYFEKGDIYSTICPAGVVLVRENCSSTEIYKISYDRVLNKIDSYIHTTRGSLETSLAAEIKDLKDANLEVIRKTKALAGLTEQLPGINSKIQNRLKELAPKEQSLIVLNDKVKGYEKQLRLVTKKITTDPENIYLKDLKKQLIAELNKINNKKDKVTANITKLKNIISGLNISLRDITNQKEDAEEDLTTFYSNLTVYSIRTIDLENKLEDLAGAENNVDTFFDLIADEDISYRALQLREDHQNVLKIFIDNVLRPSVFVDKKIEERVEKIKKRINDIKKKHSVDTTLVFYYYHHSSPGSRRCDSSYKKRIYFNTDCSVTYSGGSDQNVHSVMLAGKCIESVDMYEKRACREYKLRIDIPMPPFPSFPGVTKDSSLTDLIKYKD